MKKAARVAAPEPPVALGGALPLEPVRPEVLRVGASGSCWPRSGRCAAFRARGLEGRARSSGSSVVVPAADARDITATATRIGTDDRSGPAAAAVGAPGPDLVGGERKAGEGRDITIDVGTWAAYGLAYGPTSVVGAMAVNTPGANGATTSMTSGAGDSSGASAPSPVLVAGSPLSPPTPPVAGGCVVAFVHAHAHAHSQLHWRGVLVLARIGKVVA